MNHAVAFSCPNCKHVYVDEAEYLDTSTFNELICENCGKGFTLLIMECLACGEETTWMPAPSLEEHTLLICGHCGEPMTVEDENASGVDY
jgi:transcription elongation factor Elf1